ncbi:PREDICTED: probable WRKY transcription factor 16 [Camelina sativa]|uniref:Probable WRKY transcription factor 16 n=1 Tax=Camelina sativa TaxID=90675 RepID=A0ABM0X6W8_CAMSA|nr:PREDICTED: probable WRKY transcription factor 16 [Camelina sativa]
MLNSMLKSVSFPPSFVPTNKALISLKLPNLRFFQVMEARNMVKVNFDSSDETLRCSFVPHLSAAFGRKGLSVLTDNQDQSYMSIASVLIFSENYVSSKESLDEFVKTLQRRREEGHIVTAIFYGVSRSNVQERVGNVSKAFLEHGTSDQVSQWRNALAEITSLPGHKTSHRQSDYESIENVAKDLYEKIFPNERIGIYSRMLPDVENLIYKQQSGVRSIGIWGMPGIGKTKLAKAVFDQMSGDYKVTCFLQNFHETFHKKGLYGLLQEHFKNLPNQKLQQKVLVVLDDVKNHLDAESFLGGVFLFSPESLIIITSRDKQVLSLCGLNRIYKVEGLSKHEAHKLLSSDAFGKNVREKNLLTELSMKVIEYANGNPLALKLYGEEMSSNERKETLFLKLKEAPSEQIVELVKSSYYALSDNEKNILVYIAFFFIGKDVDYVSRLLQDLGFFPDIGINRLVENSLVTISKNRLEMHGMIQAVVREIGRCHKLKINEDTKTNFKCLLGTDDIEAISLDASNLEPDINLSSLGSMYNLRFLKVYYSDPEKNRRALESLPYGLKILHWEYYPLQSLPQDFNPSNLVELNMPYSQLQTLWRGTKNLKMLKRINLRYSQKLLEVDELSEALNLERIDLCGCNNLQSFPVIHQLQKLRVVDLSGCTQIKSVPELPSTVELKFEGSSNKSIFSQGTLIVGSLHEILDKQRKPLLEISEPILDFLKLRRFLSKQERVTNPEVVEFSSTFKRRMCQTAREMSRSLQRGLTNLNLEYDVFKIRPSENLMFTKLKEDRS